MTNPFLALIITLYTHPHTHTSQGSHLILFDRNTPWMWTCVPSLQCRLWVCLVSMPSPSSRKAVQLSPIFHLENHISFALGPGRQPLALGIGYWNVGWSVSSFSQMELAEVSKYALASRTLEGSPCQASLVPAPLRSLSASPVSVPLRLLASFPCHSAPPPC